MEASAQHQPSPLPAPPERPPLEGPLSPEFAFEGPGVARLSLMVTTVLDVMTSLDDPASGPVSPPAQL